MKSDVTAKAGARRVPRTIVFGAILFALLGGGVYSFVSLSNANRWLRHTDEVRVKIALLAATLLDAETGLRGYLITGADSFLAPYDGPRALEGGQLDEVRRLTSDNPQQQARLHALETLISEEFGDSPRSRAATERDRAAREPLALLRSTSGRWTGARAARGHGTEEARLDRLRERDATWRWGLTAALLIGGALAFAFAATRMTCAAASPRSAGRAPKKSSACSRACSPASTTASRCWIRRGKPIFANAAAARMIGSIHRRR